jgi:putative membrane protein
MPPSDWWHPMWWFPMFPLAFMVICLVVFLFIMVPMMARHGSPWSHWRESRDYPSTRAVDILNERFARGEINKEEYEEKKRIISQG